MNQYKHTRKTEKHGEVTAVTNYDIPRKGDTIYSYGFEFVLEEDMKMRIDWDFDQDTKKYIPKPMTDGNGNIVFIGQDITWRKGESFTKA
jgi:hypothetical protein